MKYGVHAPRKRFTWQRWLAIGVGLVAVIVLAGLLFLQSWYSSNLRPVSTDSQATTVEIVIEDGESTVAIAEKLAANGLIKNARAFTWYVQHDAPDSGLQSGIYSLSPALSAKDIASLLASGRVDTSLITVLPGLSLIEIRESLIGQGFGAESVDAALAANYKASVLDGRPSGADLEGYIFPESIIITSRSTPEDVISQLLAVFDERVSLEILAGIEARGLTLFEAVTLASIVQLEVAEPELQKKVAGVFYNRLEAGDLLGSDPTFFYAAELLGQEVEINIDSPYNTRINPGLPPGPIGNFNISALEAVAFPEISDAYYFVSGDDGITYFSKTLDEHEANITKHCIELCRLP